MFSAPGNINATVLKKNMHYILKEKALFLNFMRLLSTWLKRKKSERGRCFLNPHGFILHFSYQDEVLKVI